jgi:hypothetical protein
MRRMLGLCFLAGMAPTPLGVGRANFLYITVTAGQATAVHAIWRPHAGAIGDGYAQQEAAFRARTVPNLQDSLRRWRDSTVRDTVVAETPVGFTVDMNEGPIVIEAAGRDSIRVAAQLTPARGSVVTAWGRALVVSADGMTPRVERRE